MAARTAIPTTHYVELGAPRTRILYARCGQSIHAREVTRLHRADPSCSTCRQLLAQDDLDVQAVLAERERAARQSPMTLVQFEQDVRRG